MSEKSKCPWCNETVSPDRRISLREKAQVIERRCPKCGKVLAAYLEGEGDFMPGIRKFSIE